MRSIEKNFEWKEKSKAAFDNIKWELCDGPVLRMHMEKCMHVLNTDASEVAISATLYQEQEQFSLPMHMIKFS